MPSLGKIRESTERAETFINWLVEIIRDRNWLKFTILLNVILIICFNPGSIKWALSLFGLDQVQLPGWYSTVILSVILLIFVVILMIAFLSKPKEHEEGFDPSLRSAVKGLRPFTQSDSELFGKLQRKVELKECLNSITDSDFRLGILVAKSGTGKTSFLQAGILPMLSEWNGNYQAIYIKFSDQDPFNIIRKAIDEQVGLTPSVLDGLEFNKMLNVAGNETSKNLVLLFDQFEQFFVHFPRIEQRRPFINAMAHWYKNQKDVPIKILFSLRSDFMNGLIEFQKAMGYSLGPHDIIELKNFTPSQATQIFEVIAENAGLQFDPNFVAETVTLELANQEDGLISPVDIQILSWIIQAQKADEIGGFNKNSYQRLGGIEGLLDRYLQRTLSRIYPESRRELLIKAMLSLIDLEQNVRSGILTEQEIIEKLRGSQNADQIKRDLKFLADKVRLLTEINREGQVGYELAHERLIPAIRRITGEVLSDAEKANILLEQRVNEWLGNNKSTRFLLRLKEYLLINKSKSFLDWGKKKELKEELLGKSKRLFIKLGGVISVFLILMMLIPLLLQTTQGQIFMIRWSLDDLTNSSLYESDETHSYISKYAAIKDYRRAKAIADNIDILIDKLFAYLTITEAAAEANQAELVTSFLDHMDELAIQIFERNPNRFDGFSTISDFTALTHSSTVEAAVKVENWDLALTIAERVEDGSDRSDIYVSISDAAANAENWDLAQRAVNHIENADIKPVALRIISEAAAKVENWELALTIADRVEDGTDRSDIYMSITEAAANAENWDLAQTTAAKIEDADIKPEAYRVISEAAAKAENWELAQSIANLIEDVSVRIKTSRSMAEIVAGNRNWDQYSSINGLMLNAYFDSEDYGAISEAAAKADNWELAHSIADRIEDASVRIKTSRTMAEIVAGSRNWDQSSSMNDLLINANFNSEDYGAISKAAAKAENWELAQTSAAKIGDDYIRQEIYKIITEVAVRAGNRELALKIVEDFVPAYDKSDLYRIISEAAAKAGSLDFALTIADKVRYPIDRSGAYRSIAKEATKARKWELAQITASKIEDATYRSDAYRAIAETAAVDKNWNLVIKVIRSQNLTSFDKAMASIHILDIWDNPNYNISDGASANEDSNDKLSSDIKFNLIFSTDSAKYNWRNIY